MNAIRLMIVLMIVCVAMLFLPKASFAGDMQPISAEDKAKVDKLLKDFDPNSFKIRYPTTNTAGQVETVELGNAKGLANLRQLRTSRRVGTESAGTNVNINIFKQASTNVNINIFKEASTNVNINIFKDAQKQARAQELNAVLQKYAR